MERFELLRIYYCSLKETLQECKYSKEKLPSWQNLVEEMRRTELYGLYALLAEFPLIALRKDVSQQSTVDTFKDPLKMAEQRKFMFSDERVLETIRYSLDRLNELEALDL